MTKSGHFRVQKVEFSVFAQNVLVEAKKLNEEENMSYGFGSNIPHFPDEEAQVLV